MKSRIIKPEFFINEDLAELPALARLLFAGLWCAADREGRLEYRPKRLKAELLPYDDCDIEELLAGLHDSGFIIIYEVDSKRYIQIINFMKHQSIHQNEKSSSIPAYSAQSPELQGITGSDGELLPPLPIPLPIPLLVGLPSGNNAGSPPPQYKDDESLANGSESLANERMTTGREEALRTVVKYIHKNAPKETLMREDTYIKRLDKAFPDKTADDILKEAKRLIGIDKDGFSIYQLFKENGKAKPVVKPTGRMRTAADL